MPSIKTVERRISNIEGFNVTIRHHGHDVRSDCGMPRQYIDFDKAASQAFTVARWKHNRFRPSFPGFDVDVLDAFGNVVPGNTKLRTVRDTYS
jgi:hypothetical protein